MFPGYFFPDPRPPAGSGRDFHIAIPKLRKVRNQLFAQGNVIDIDLENPDIGHDGAEAGADEGG